MDTAGAVKTMHEKKALREAAKVGKVAVAPQPVPMPQPQQQQRHHGQHHHRQQQPVAVAQPVQQYYAQQPYPAAAYAQQPVAYQPGRYGEVPMIVPQQVPAYAGAMKAHRADYARV